VPDLSILSSNLPATIATFAAGVTAFFAALKFYSDKAAKVTDFRKAWIETLRLAVAEFSGHTHTIAGRIAIRKRHDESTLPVPSESPKRKSWNALFTRPEPSKPQFDKGFETELLSHWSGLRLSYNKIVLHLNPAEHRAYIRAEEAIAAYTKDLKECADVRKQVSTFLHWCIQHADATSRALMLKKKKLYQWPWWGSAGAAVAPDVVNDHAAPCLSFECAQKDIMTLCTDPGSCLLLSAFATRQLLHGSYEQVHDNVPKIERGIRTVDTATAIVIKGVWEAIKRGEPVYRHTSRIALVASAVLIAFILVALYTAQPAASKTRTFSASCDLPGVTTLAPQGTPGSAAARRLSCEGKLP
jgi:hypothetical protein